MKITKGVKADAGAGYDIQSMTLGISPVTGAVQWTISGEGKGRLSTYTAQVDGSGVRRSRNRTRRQAFSTAPPGRTGRAARRVIVARHGAGGAPGGRAVRRLEDDGYFDVRLQQELERPRSGPPFAASTDGTWELEYRRPQVDRMEYRIEADGESFCDPHNPLRAPGAFGDKSVVEFPGYAARLARRARPRARRADRRARRAVVPAGHRPAPAAPAARRPRRRRVRAPRPQLTRLVAHAIADEPASRPAASRCSTRRDRDEDYSASARYATQRWPPASPSSPPPPRSPASAPASARSPCCTRAGSTRARSAR